MSIQNALIIPDCHVPFEDEKALQLMLDGVFDFYGPRYIHQIIFLGDFFDFYDVSNHQKDPRILVDIREEVEKGHQWFSKIRSLWPQAEMLFLIGNHEFRLNRYILANASSLLGLVDIDGILRPDKFKIQVIPYGRHQKLRVLNSEIFAKHEPTAGGANHAMSSLRKSSSSLIYGHTHQIQHAQLKSLDGRYLRAWSAGCLVKMEHDVFNYLKERDQWSHGFMIVSTNAHKEAHVSQIQIFDSSRMHFQGFQYQL